MSHPSASSTSREYDALVIGAGQAGDPIARTLARSGRRTALIERRAVGGTCVNRGCTPTKTLQSSATLLHTMRHAADWGIDVSGNILPNASAIFGRKTRIVGSFRSQTEDSLQKIENLDLIYGAARFANPNTMIVTLRHENEPLTISAKTIILDVGQHPQPPEINGLDSLNYLDATTILNLQTIPESLLILGGGYIGVEYAQMFRRFGSEVTIIEKNDHLLREEDEDVSAAVTEVFRREGITVMTGADVLQAGAANAHAALVVRDNDGGERRITATHLLVATGWAPNTKELDLDRANIETDDNGYIKVNNRLQTTASGIWAVGDVTGHRAFTHLAYDDHRIVCMNLIEQQSATTTDRIVPYAIYTDPQLGRVGMTEKEARKSGKQIRVAKLPMEKVDRAIETNQTTGFMKAIVDAENSQVLGAAIFGAQGGEIAAMLQIAMIGKMPYTMLKNAIFAHPTLAEGLNSLFLALDDDAE